MTRNWSQFRLRRDPRQAVSVRLRFTNHDDIARRLLDVFSLRSFLRGVCGTRYCYISSRS